MKKITKKDLLLIINIYQNYINDFINISTKDLTNIYKQIERNNKEY
mgnify:CR=1 FL=1